MTANAAPAPHGTENLRILSSPLMKAPSVTPVAPSPEPVRRGSPGVRPDRLYLPFDEYLEREEGAEFRHEWLNGLGLWEDGEELGELRPVYGYDEHGDPAMCTERHSDVVTNLVVLLATALRDRPYKVHCQALLVRIPGGRTRYPDVLVAPVPSDFEPHREGKRLVLRNPAVLFEVLSDSTADTDRTEKLAEYGRIPSATDYLILDQEEAVVRHYRRANGSWNPVTLEGPDAAVELAGLGLKLPLAEIYRGVA